MRYLSGSELAKKLLQNTKKRLQENDIQPILAVVLVGDDKPSHTYVNLKERAAQNLGIGFRKIMRPKECSQNELLSLIQDLNQDEEITGILVQLPLPKHLDKDIIIQSIHPKKDVDGFHPDNARLFFENKPCLVPVFSRAIMEMIRFSQTHFVDKRAIVIANSDQFGMMMLKQLTVHSIKGEYILRTSLYENLERIRFADIVIVACGQPGFINKDMVSDMALVIDGGISVVGEHVIGDFELSGLKNTHIVVSPVPDGVGPVTIACLLDNVVTAAITQSMEIA